MFGRELSELVCSEKRPQGERLGAVITMLEAVSAVYWLAAVLYSADPIAVPQLPDVGAYWAANHNKPTVELLKSGEVAV